MTKQTILPKNMTPAMRCFAAACCSFLLLFSLLFPAAAGRLQRLRQALPFLMPPP